MHITLTGTIEVDIKDFGKIKTLPYTYTKSGGGHAASYFGNKKTKIFMPRNFQKFMRTTGMKRVEVTSTDKRVEQPLKTPVRLKKSFSLRDYQKGPVAEVVKALKDNRTLNSCVLQADTGFGKTYILPQIAADLNQRTLILADRNLLIKQMYDEFTSNTDEDVVVLNSKKPKLGSVNIATLQMFLQNPEYAKELSKKIGFVVVDECHIAPADKFIRVISSFPAKYRLGLSATPTRSDGLTQVISDVFGDKKIVAKNPNKLLVKIIGVFTKIPVFYNKRSEFEKGFTKAVTSKESLSLLKETIVALKKSGRKIMVYSTYKSIQEVGQKVMEELGLKTAIINSEVSHKERDKIIADFNEGSLDGLIAGVIMSKGISIHRLDTIISMAPHTKESIVQTIGRLRRDHSDKQIPLFIDFGYEGKALEGTLKRFELLRKMETEHDSYFQYDKNAFEKILRRKNAPSKTTRVS